MSIVDGHRPVPVAADVPPASTSRPARDPWHRRRIVRAGAAAGVVACLAGAALLLLRTTVPGNLTLPAVDVDSVFGAELVSDTRRYERFFYVDWLLAQIALLVVLAVYARKGAALARESAAGPIGTGLLLGMLGLCFVWLVQLPFGLAVRWWVRHEGTSRAGYVDWLLGYALQLLVEVVVLCAVLVILMGLARRLRERWWLPAAGALAGIVALFLLLYPYVDRGTHSLAPGPLSAAASRYETELGTGHVPVRVRDVSDHTTSANAIAQGLGPTRRIVFSDTHLQPPFSLNEQQVTLAHEVAHHARQHNLKGLAWFALIAVLATWILMRVTRSRGGMGSPQAVPVALLVVALLYVSTKPAVNWVSRRMETEADWQALEVTRDPEAATWLMVHASETSFADPDPPAWAQLLYGTHPSQADRVALARAWAERHR